MKPALIVGIALAALVALPTAGRAQAKTDFSGTWTLDPAKSDAAPAQAGRGGRGGRGGGGGIATSLTIQQTPAQITIERATGELPTSAIYKLDGSESTNTLGDIFLSRSKVSWDGPKLVVTTAKSLGQNPNGMMSEDSKDVYSLDGGVLTIVTTMRITPSASNREQTRKLVYNKR
jgi:hypothetical protein